MSFTLRQNKHIVIRKTGYRERVYEYICHLLLSLRPQIFLYLWRQFINLRPTSARKAEKFWVLSQPPLLIYAGMRSVFN